MKKLATLISFLIVGLVSYWSFIDMKPQKPLQESSDPTEFKTSHIASYRLRLSYVYEAAIQLGYKVTGNQNI